MANTVIKQPVKPAPKPEEPTLEEVLSDIGKHLERIEGRISIERTHSIDSHLKGLLRALGFRPNRNWKDGDYLGLYRQIVASFDQIGGEVPKNNEWMAMALAKTTLSNLAAEVRHLESPETPKEAPLS